ncbi:hypothetical protein [Parahaliea mediterranea]|uniref:hypothetical protein n=1 Tax=Parahaliea mediterranea TaxID=651086 RepID=UPI000E2FB172|nr:hypothetical protein [Parahaliea mediterranea]
MEPLYNVYFAGEVLPGQDETAVRQRLQGLFKADEATLARLFSGKAQLIKRECDKPTALKYKLAMEKAGAKPVIRRHAPAQHAAGATASTTASQPQSRSGQAPEQKTSDPQTSRPQTMAERVAALAAEPASQAGRTATAAPATATTPAATGDEGGLSLSPPRSEVLRPDERQPFHPREVDTSALSVAPGGERLSEPELETAPSHTVAPDTRHLSVATSGENIPNLPRFEAAPAPDTSAIDLAPPGTDFSDCATPPEPAPALDLDGLAMAPSGADLLEARYRSTAEPAAPDTSHLSLDKP